MEERHAELQQACTEAKEVLAQVKLVIIFRKKYKTSKRLLLAVILRALFIFTVLDLLVNQQIKNLSQHIYS